MAFAPFTAEGTASAALALSKTAWKLGTSLSKLNRDAKIVDIMIKNLAGEVKSLGIECDLIYTKLEEVLSKSETGSPPPYDVDGVDDRMWNCLATQVDETSQTMQELELFVIRVRGDESNFIGQAQRQRALDRSKDQIGSISIKVCRHTEKLRATLLLINTVLTHLAPCRADRRLSKELGKLQDMIENLQRTSEADPQSRPSHTEATLMQCAREVILKGTTMYEASLAGETIAGNQGAANNNIHVVEWVNTLETIRQDQQYSDRGAMASSISPILSREKTRTVATSANSGQRIVQERENVDAVDDDSDDDLDIDLAKAALGTGTKAFDEQEWEEADTLLQEALQVLRQLPKRQRAFCDIFGLHFKLAVCAYHTQEPTDAEEALVSLVEQSANTDEHRGYIYHATHLLSQLYIRMGQVDRARSECEKALQARRRLLGKRSNAALESTALMAHIYVLLNNRARAKSCLAMIPEERRDAILKIVEESLGTEVEHLDFSSLLSRSTSEDSDLTMKRLQNRLSASTLGMPMEGRCYTPTSGITKSPAPSIRQSHQRIPSYKTDVEDRQSITMKSLASAEGISESSATEKERPNEVYSPYPLALNTAALGHGAPPEANQTLKAKTISRKEIIEKIGCQPKDQIEEAVCNGDHSALASLLNRKKDFWRSKLRKRVRPERVTALHFAALFGEIEMARRLLGSSFNINEVPFGYTTTLTPLKFAIGARQVDMVEFLIANGARPSEPESWSTLAGQLMNRSWLNKTMSEAERDFVPNKIVAILSILLNRGWDINEPYEASGATVIHQAVTFWTGSINWDLNLRATITSFLCEQGADPFQANKEGKTPYDIVSTSGDRDLLLVLHQYSKTSETYSAPAELAELSSSPIR